MIPLGGLGEVGMNCLLLEEQGAILVLDCGVTFPDEDRGVDLVHPDFRYLVENRDRVCGVFLTHGHEDHIGALPYLLRELQVPVWGPAHALALVRRRLQDRTPDRARASVDLRAARVRERYRVGPFEVEPIRVSHSIVEATALAVRTSAGVVLHSGDFKFDPEPADGERTDEARLEELGDEGVALLLSDSTNVDNFGRSSSEAEVARALEELVATAQQRVVVGLFSSNVQRLINLGHIARRHGRRIGLLGRSLKTHVETAQQLGHLSWGSEHRVLGDHLSNCPSRELLLLAGGTQAEAGAALTRLSRAAHSSLSLAPGDRVILSSRIIPGNDRKVSQLMSALLRLEVDLHTAQRQREIHASGHATRSELEHMFQLVRPRAFIPVHGTRHHLHSHAQLAAECGVTERLVIENGQIAELAGGRLTRAGEVPSGRVYIDLGSHTLQPEILRQRAQLGRAGLAQLLVTLDSEDEPLHPARVFTLGVPCFDLEENRKALCREADEWLRRNSKKWRRRGLEPQRELERFLSWRLERWIGRRPTVHVEILRA